MCPLQSCPEVKRENVGKVPQHRASPGVCRPCAGVRGRAAGEAPAAPHLPAPCREGTPTKPVGPNLPTPGKHRHATMALTPSQLGSKPEERKCILPRLTGGPWGSAGPGRLYFLPSPPNRAEPTYRAGSAKRQAFSQLAASSWSSPVVSGGVGRVQ